MKIKAVKKGKSRCRAGTHMTAAHKKPCTYIISTKRKKVKKKTISEVVREFDDEQRVCLQANLRVIKDEDCVHEISRILNGEVGI